MSLDTGGRREWKELSPARVPATGRPLFHQWKEGKGSRGRGSREGRRSGRHRRRGRAGRGGCRFFPLPFLRPAAWGETGCYRRRRQMESGG